MFSDTISDQNVFLDNQQQYYKEDSYSYLNSPLVSKNCGDQRYCFTESKIPFKNSTNDRNLPPCLTSTKKNMQAKELTLVSESFQGRDHFEFTQQSDRNGAKAANIRESAFSSIGTQSAKENFQGDRFIPCRMGNNKYEMHYQHEELQLAQRISMASGQNEGNEADGMNGQGLQSNNLQQANNSNGGSTGVYSNNPSEQNNHIYSNLLQTQCLGNSIYGNENYYENLSSYDASNYNGMNIGSMSSQPVGLFSTQSNQATGTSLNSAITHTINKSKKSIFKYQNNYKRKTLISQENDPFAITPLLNIDSTDYSSPSVKNIRKIPKMPFKVLDAPSLQDDFYLNLVDWSSSNILAVGLGRAVYIWSACTSRVTKLCEVPLDDSITSVGWSQRGSHLAVGTNSGDTQIWDTNHCKLVRTLSGHLSRVGTVAWNGSIVSTGSRDRNILQRDLRAHNQQVQKLVGHKQEVCGLRWSFDDQQLASGGNDNKLMVWSLQSDQPLVKFSDHTAAVKAIGWSPHQNGLLASGGGTADRCIRFWNTHTLQPINYIDTGSQVCNLMFSKNVNEIVSTHGYSLNQIIVWKYPSMQKVTTLTGHTYRVLYLSMSPDGQSIVTGAGDETLRFWNVFPSVKGKSDSFPSYNGNSSSLFPSSMDIR